MRIAQTPDGRYVKVMSPEFQGLVGRLYFEIRERKAIDEEQLKVFGEQERRLSKVAAGSEEMTIRYNELTALMRDLFPEDGSAAKIDRALDVAASVRATSFISTTEETAPLIVASDKLVKNLNANYLEGMTLEELKLFIKEEVRQSEERITQRLEDMRGE